jgi:hypothetical protein
MHFSKVICKFLLDANMMIAWREGTFVYHCGMRKINVITVNVNRNGLCVATSERCLYIASSIISWTSVIHDSCRTHIPERNVGELSTYGGDGL